MKRLLKIPGDRSVSKASWSRTKDSLENMKSPEYENYYDNKFHIFEELKMEVPDSEVSHSDCNVNNEIISEDKKLSKFIVQNKIKHEATENRLPMNVTIKTERIVEEVILDNNKNMSVPYKFTVQDVQLNSDERLLKDNVNLMPNNEQTNMPRVAELNELHKCKLCDIDFDHHDNMLIHTSLVHNEKTFKCELCGKQLNNLTNLKSHIINKHKEPTKVGEIIFKCINCNAEFSNKLSLNDHAKLCQKEEEIITYKCDSYDGVYKSEQNLRNHVKRMHTNKEHKCKSCGAVFKKYQYLWNHMKNIHYDYGSTFDCWCGKQFRSPEYLRGHKRRQHERINNGRFQCDSCQKVFTAKQNLVKHIKSLHYYYGRTFACWCGKQFQSPIHLSDHKQQLHKRKITDTYNGKFQCDSCQKIFKYKQTLALHIKSLHYDYGRTFDCWCGKQLRSPFHLYHHKRQHERKIKDADNEKFQCDSCQKFFTKKHYLDKHIKLVHYDYGRTFDCWCGKQFRTPVHLYHHKRQHERKIKDTENGRFQCESCQKIFKYKKSLYVHTKKVHYDYGRKFVCWCGKQFRSPLYLLQHKRRLHECTDKGRFQCDSCQKVFTNKQNLVKHINSFHYYYGRTFTCWCGKQFQSPIHLSDHKQQLHERKIIDTDNGRFQCDSCQKIFKCKQNLAVHIKSLHYEYGRTFDCWCGKQYRSPLHLYHHKRQHNRKIKETENGRFQCESCQKIFKYKHSLYVHIKKIHYDYGRKFFCWCGKQFRSPIYLHQHKRRLHECTDKGKFQCVGCQKIFKRKQSLFIHQKRFHYESKSSSDV